MAGSEDDGDAAQGVASGLSEPDGGGIAVVESAQLI
jgi:hypothetical protein